MYSADVQWSRDDSKVGVATLIQTERCTDIQTDRQTEGHAIAIATVLTTQRPYMAIQTNGTKRHCHKHIILAQVKVI